MIRLIVLWLISFHALANPMPIFDAHLHYGGEKTTTIISPSEVLDKLNRNHITHAQMSSTPNIGTRILYEKAAHRIVPFLSFYDSLTEKGVWGDDPNVLDRMEHNFKQGHYVGLGEFHLFKKDVDSPILAEVIEFAKKHQLIIQFHGDLEIIDKIFEIYPNATVLWAHLGTRPEPEFLTQALNRYPNLYVDTSVRDESFVNNRGKLKQEWADFFIQQSDRVLIGVDTFSPNRWLTFDKVVRNIRFWLEQLPLDVQRKLAHENAHRLFDPYLKLEVD